MNDRGQDEPGLPAKMPIRSHEVETAFTAIYRWDYEGELEDIRTLYAKSLDGQWNAMRDLDWDRDWQTSSFPTSFSVDGVPVSRSTFWKDLPAGVRLEVQKRIFSHTLSNILHGEQGAMMIASQLVNAVPDTHAKLFAAIQTVDEARHVEVFSRYLKRLHKIHGITPGLGQLLDTVVSAPSWMHKLVGMQVVIEGFALGYFRTVRIECADPMLQQILRLISRDEARHVSFGVSYLRDTVSRLPDAQRADLEDFAFESTCSLKDPHIDRSIRKRLFELWQWIGLDPAETWQRIFDEVAGPPGSETEKDPLRDLIVPTLRRVGLMSPRIEAAFDQLYRATTRGHADLCGSAREPPADLQAWVSGDD